MCEIIYIFNTLCEHKTQPSKTVRCSRYDPEIPTACEWIDNKFRHSYCRQCYLASYEVDVKPEDPRIHEIPVPSTLDKTLDTALDTGRNMLSGGIKRFQSIRDKGRGLRNSISRPKSRSSGEIPAQQANQQTIDEDKPVSISQNIVYKDVGAWIHKNSNVQEAATVEDAYAGFSRAEKVEFQRSSQTSTQYGASPSVSSSADKLPSRYSYTDSDDASDYHSQRSDSPDSYSGRRWTAKDFAEDVQDYHAVYLEEDIEACASEFGEEAANLFAEEWRNSHAWEELVRSEPANSRSRREQRFPNTQGGGLQSPQSKGQYSGSSTQASPRRRTEAAGEDGRKISQSTTLVKEKVLGRQIAGNQLQSPDHNLHRSNIHAPTQDRRLETEEHSEFTPHRPQRSMTDSYFSESQQSQLGLETVAEESASDHTTSLGLPAGKYNHPNLTSPQSEPRPLQHSQTWNEQGSSSFPTPKRAKTQTSKGRHLPQDIGDHGLNSSLSSGNHNSARPYGESQALRAPQGSPPQGLGLNLPSIEEGGSQPYQLAAPPQLPITFKPKNVESYAGFHDNSRRATKLPSSSSLQKRPAQSKPSSPPTSVTSEPTGNSRHTRFPAQNAQNKSPASSSISVLPDSPSRYAQAPQPDTPRGIAQSEYLKKYRQPISGPPLVHPNTLPLPQTSAPTSPATSFQSSAPRAMTSIQLGVEELRKQVGGLEVKTAGPRRDPLHRLQTPYSIDPYKRESSMTIIPDMSPTPKPGSRLYRAPSHTPTPKNHKEYEVPISDLRPKEIEALQAVGLYAMQRDMLGDVEEEQESVAGGYGGVSGVAAPVTNVENSPVEEKVSKKGFRKTIKGVKKSIFGKK